MLAVRGRHDAFAIGTFRELGGSNPSVLTYVREIDGERHRAVREQPVAVPAADRAEPAALERVHARRDDRVR